MGYGMTPCVHSCSTAVPMCYCACSLPLFPYYIIQIARVYVPVPSSTLVVRPPRERPLSGRAISVLSVSTISFPPPLNYLATVKRPDYRGWVRASPTFVSLLLHRYKRISQVQRDLAGMTIAPRSLGKWLCKAAGQLGSPLVVWQSLSSCVPLFLPPFLRP